MPKRRFERDLDLSALHEVPHDRQRLEREVGAQYCLRIELAERISDEYSAHRRATASWRAEYGGSYSCALTKWLEVAVRGVHRIAVNRW